MRQETQGGPRSGRSAGRLALFPDPAYSTKLSSHGIGVSPDGKYTYLPSMTSIGAAEGTTPEYTLVLDTRTLKLYQVLATGGTPHHVKAFRDANGRQLVLIEHFNWNTASCVENTADLPAADDSVCSVAHVKTLTLSDRQFI